MPSKSSSPRAFDKRHVVSDIVNVGLCVRCGACEPACPVDIIRFDETAYPYITEEERCITNCTRCIAICPGETVNFARLDKRIFGKEPHPASITGIATRALVAHATNSEVRQNGASGGVATQLLTYLLDKRVIDGALVLTSRSGPQGWYPEPFIARTGEELAQAQGSTYALVPHLKALKEIEQVNGRYAVVGLPCHVHALRRYQKFSKKLAERVKLTIGLYCNLAFEPYVVDDLCELAGISRSEVAKFSFRYGQWPGGLVAQRTDGTIKKVLRLEEFRDEFNLLKLLYVPSRCNTCIDFSSEYADIALGDPWLKGPNGKLMFTEGWTTVLVRNESGEHLIRQAETDGYIKIRDISLETYMITFENAARYKRSFVPQYMALRRLFGFRTPKYYRNVGYGRITDFPFTLIRMAILGAASFKFFRINALRLAQTRLALFLLAWNRRRKEEKFRSTYAEQQSRIKRMSNRQL
jgi:coenzyme F420 hydrogenase subunit beta